jgi:hypothetical protein
LGSSPRRLTPLQNRLLEAFFRHERGFFLTGGAALAGFHLHHRDTTDLDLFTTDGDAFERGSHALRAAVADIGGEIVLRQDAPGFRRFVASSGGDAVVVDLVWDRVPQVHPDKPELAPGIRVDPAEEILANKLTAALSRAEERDLVDLFFLEKAGHSIEAALPRALLKDGACTPGALAYVLGQIDIPPGITLPGGVAGGDLKTWLDGLVGRLLRLAVPPGTGR